MLRNKLFSYGLAVLMASAALMCAVVPVQAADMKPNIVIIWGDDIGQSNISAYTKGLMGYHTPEHRPCRQ